MKDNFNKYPSIMIYSLYTILKSGLMNIRCFPQLCNRLFAAFNCDPADRCCSCYVRVFLRNARRKNVSKRCSPKRYRAVLT